MIQMVIEWQSFFDPVEQERVRTVFPQAPDEFTRLYAVGDAPFICDQDDKFPAYPIPDIQGQYGGCTNMLGLRKDAADSAISFAQLFTTEFSTEFAPIARDGGGELLLLKSIDLSIWHFSPNGRLDPQIKKFRIADSFQHFLMKIEFLS